MQNTDFGIAGSMIFAEIAAEPHAQKPSGACVAIRRKSVLSEEGKRPGRQRTRILLVDDHEVVLDGLRSYLHSRKEYDVVGTARCVEDAVVKSTILRPDVVVLDLGLGGKSGFEAIGELREQLNPPRFLIYSVHGTREYLRAAITAGVSGYILKSSSVREFMKAVRAVSRGGTYFERDLAGCKQGTDIAATGGIGGNVEKRSEGMDSVAQSAKELLDRRFPLVIPMKQLALEVGIHPSDLDRQFRRCYGVTPKQYTDRLRQRAVLDSLKKGDCKGSHISTILKFRDDPSFYRWVHRVFGIPYSQVMRAYGDDKAAGQIQPNPTQPNAN